MDDARQQAVARAKRVFDLLAAGEKPSSYGYFDRPVKEEIVKDVREGGRQIALITRNRYGALVLNSANVLFADVDFPPAKAGGIVEALAFLFMPKKREAKRAALAVQTAERITQWAKSHPERGCRLYRTAAGLRLLFTDRLYDPTAADTLALLREVGSDPMYVRLTQQQECFRARLTAKPWRCGCARPPNAYPWEDAEAERRFRQWEKQYTERDAGYRACELLATFGSMADLAAVRAVVAAHDQGARIQKPAPLA
jgi:hypothetical protein